MWKVLVVIVMCIASYMLGYNDGKLAQLVEIVFDAVSEAGGLLAVDEESESENDEQ